MQDSSDRMLNRLREPQAIIIAAVVTGVLTLVGSVTAAYVAGTRSVQGQGPETTVTATTDRAATPTPQVVVPATPVPAVPDPASSVTSPSGENAFPVAYLDLNDVVAYERCKHPGNTGYPWSGDAASIGGEQYPSSITCRVTNRATSGFLDYVVPAGASRLTGTVGMDDTSPNTTVRGEFTVTTFDGRTLFRETVGYDERQELDVPLDGIGRVRIQFRVAGSEENPSDRHAVAVWGDVRFTR